MSGCEDHCQNHIIWLRTIQKPYDMRMNAGGHRGDRVQLDSEDKVRGIGPHLYDSIRTISEVLASIEAGDGRCCGC